MQDRIVEFPNRYRLAKVSGTDDTFDLIPAPGEVVQEGTPLSMGTLLKHDTAAGLNLDETAVPDEALQKLTGAFRTFRDEESGQLYSVETEISSWGEKPIDWFDGVSGIGRVQPNTGYSEPTLFRWGRRIAVCGGLAEQLSYDNYNYYRTMAVADLDTGEIICSHKVGAGSDEYEYGTFASARQVTSSDGALVIWNNNFMVDLKHGVFAPVSNSYVYQWFNTEDFWGYFYMSDYSSRLCYFARRGSTSFRAINLGYSGNSTFYYAATPIGFDGNRIAVLEYSSGVGFELRYLDLDAETYSAAVATYNYSGLGLGQISGYEAQPLVFANGKGFIHPSVRLRSYVNGEEVEYYYGCKKPLIIDIATGTSNWSSITAADFETGGISYIGVADYVGSTPDKAWFSSDAYNAKFVSLNRATGELKKEGEPSSGATGLVRLNRMSETLWDIPEAPRVLVSGASWIDTGDPYLARMPVRSRRSGYDYKSSSVMAIAGGTVTTPEAVGFTFDGNRPNLVGGDVQRQITRLVPVDPLGEDVVSDG